MFLLVLPGFPVPSHGLHPNHFCLPLLSCSILVRGLSSSQKGPSVVFHVNPVFESYVLGQERAQWQVFVQHAQDPGVDHYGYRNKPNLWPLEVGPRAWPSSQESDSSINGQVEPPGLGLGQLALAKGQRSD